MQVLIPKGIPCAEEGKVSFEIQWIIPNWRQVRRDVRRVESQKAFFETGRQRRQPTQKIQTTWLLGLKNVPVPLRRSGIPGASTRRMVRVYWQLLDVKGPDSQLKLQAKVCSQLCGGTGGVAARPRDEKNQEVRIGEVIEEENEYLDLDIALGNNVDFEQHDDKYINSNGAVQYSLVLTFKTLAVDSPSSEDIQMEQFKEQSHDQLRENLATLLNDNSNGDLKIVTSDGVELTAHQTILKARCPVFAGMLNCDLSETQTGIVKMEDVSGKIMKILLHYFYTGDLQDGWRKGDTIVEFVYAAGKYQMTSVLELLDNLLGKGAQDEVSNLDVQLLDLTGKLSLKNAEERLLQRVIAKVTAAKSSKELFQLFGHDSEEISRKAEMLANGKVLEILDCALGSSGSEQKYLTQRGLTLLALVQRNGLKTLEKILLKKFAEVTSKFTTAEELFALFGMKRTE